ncbi:hypothetical protein [Salana multivorans]
MSIDSTNVAVRSSFATSLKLVIIGSPLIVPKPTSASVAMIAYP